MLCTKEGQLLQKKLELWDEIKDGMNLIINGQHNVIASKFLQEWPVREAKKLSFRFGKHTSFGLPRRTSSSGYQSGTMHATS
jgi:hypothetical protein